MDPKFAGRLAQMNSHLTSLNPLQAFKRCAGCDGQIASNEQTTYAMGNTPHTHSLTLSVLCREPSLSLSCALTKHMWCDVMWCGVVCFTECRSVLALVSLRVRRAVRPRPGRHQLSGARRKAVLQSMPRLPLTSPQLTSSLRSRSLVCHFCLMCCVCAAIWRCAGGLPAALRPALHGLQRVCAERVWGGHRRRAGR